MGRERRRAIKRKRENEKSLSIKEGLPAEKGRRVKVPARRRRQRAMEKRAIKVLDREGKQSLPCFEGKIGLVGVKPKKKVAREKRRKSWELPDQKKKGTLQRKRSAETAINETSSPKRAGELDKRRGTGRCCL